MNLPSKPAISRSQSTDRCRNDNWDGQDWTGVVDEDDEKEQLDAVHKDDQKVEGLAAVKDEQMSQQDPKEEGELSQKQASAANSLDNSPQRQEQEDLSESSEELVWMSSDEQETTDQKSSNSDNKADCLKKGQQLNNQKRDRESKKKDGSAKNKAGAMNFSKHLKKFNVFTDLYQSSQDKMITQNIRKSMDERKKDRQQILKMQINKDMTWWQRVLDFRFTPNKGFKIRWDLFIIILSIYNSFMIPIQFAMPNTMDQVILIAVIDQFVDILFAIDIIIMFRTSYQDQKTDNIIRDSKMIAINYIKGRFFIDLLASIPFDLIGRLMTTTPDAQIDPSTTTFLSILKMTRLLRLGRMVSYFQINQAFKFGMKMLQMFLFILIFLNLVACIWIKIFNIIPQDFVELGASSSELEPIYKLVNSENQADQLLYQQELQKLIDKYGYPILLPEKLKFSLEQYYNSNPFWQYNLMIFMTLFNIMGNDISPTELQIFWVSAALMLTGFLVVSNLIGEFSNILNDIYEADKNNEIEENSEIVGQVLQSMQVPEEIQNRVYDYLEFGTVKTDYVRSKKFFELISDCQQDIIKMISFEQAMRESGLFSSHNDLSQIKFFIQNMEVHVYLPQDVIIKQNDMADSETEFVYFIIEGFAQVIQERRDFCYFHQENINLFLTEHEKEEDANEEVTRNLQIIAEKGIVKGANDNAQSKDIPNIKSNLAKAFVQRKPKSDIGGQSGDNDDVSELHREINRQASLQRIRNQKDNALQDKLKQKFQQAKDRNKSSLLNKILKQKEKKQVDTQKEMILQRFKSMFNAKKQKNFVCINEVSRQKQSYFGEIAAISNLRRTSTLVAQNPMLLGKVKINFFKQYYENNTNFRKRVQKHVFTYNDWNMKMIFNMLRNAQLFGSQYAGQHFQQVCLDTLMNLKEESFHHMDCILQLGEVSDRLYFVTQGRVAVFVNMTQDYNEDLIELNDNILDEENNKKKDKDQNRKQSKNNQTDDNENQKNQVPRQSNKLLQILNVGSNFNQISAILSQQTIFTYCAIGSNCQVASISKQDYEDLCEKHHFIKKLKRFIEEIYNDSGKKYDFQRYTHQNHWANGINVQGLDQNENEDIRLVMNNPIEDSDDDDRAGNVSEQKDQRDQLQPTIKEEHDEDCVVESDSADYSVSEVSVDSKNNSLNVEGGFREDGQVIGLQNQGETEQPKAIDLFKNAFLKKGTNYQQSTLNDSLKRNQTEIAKDQQQGSDDIKVGLAKFMTSQFAQKDEQADQKSSIGKERDRILQKLNWNIFNTNSEKENNEKQQKKEELKEQMILFQLKSNKNWLKISCQLKFRQFIHVITHKVRHDPDYMEKNFQIFAQVDMLQKARLIRMMNLRMIMARQIVINNSIKLELIEKMNNVTCLAKYRNKNLALNKAIIERAKRMHEKEQNKEKQKHSQQQQQSNRSNIRMTRGSGVYMQPQKQLFDIDNNSVSQQQRPKGLRKKNQNNLIQNKNNQCEISPEFVSNQGDSSDCSRSLNNIQRLNSQEILPQIDVARPRSPQNTNENQLQSMNQYHLPPIVQIQQPDAAFEPTQIYQADPVSNMNKKNQNQDTINQLVLQQEQLIQSRQKQIESLMNCLKQNESHFRDLARQNQAKKHKKQDISKTKQKSKSNN